MKRKVLVVAAHADDEALGCSGTVAKLVDEGSEAALVVMTDGTSSRVGGSSDDARRRADALKCSSEILGFTAVQCFDFPDNAMDRATVLEIAQSIEGFCDQWGRPDVVMTHHGGDLNIDHELTCRAVLTAFRPQPHTPLPHEIWSFEVASSTDWFGGDATKRFSPDLFVSIESTLERKLSALEAYVEEMRPWPHARSLEAIRHLAAFRGSQVGLEAAEAFSVERRVIR